ncbi:MAG: chemotaxis protein CheW [Gemmatimonadota bacterium]
MTTSTLDMSATDNAASGAPGSMAQGGKYLTLFLGAEEYGLDVTKVQEIIRMLPITRVPRTPAFLRGIVNLRGRIVPVLELRARLGLAPIEEARETCIVVVRSGDLLMGIIVDEVRDVLDILSDEIQAVPDFGVSVDTTYLSGLARRQERVVLLLEIARVLTDLELNAVRRTATATTAAS